jgi:uncharacterized protein
VNIDLIKVHVYNKLSTESSGHDYLHALRVVKNCEKFIADYEVDIDVIIAAAYVHDLIDHKLSHNFKSTEEEIRDLLLESDLKKDQVNLVIDIINNISYSKGNVPASLEGKIVQDADRLDALGAIGIARTFAYGGKNDRLIYSLDEKDTENSVFHFHDKLFKLTNLMNTKRGKELARNRTKFMEKFISELNDEIK